MAITIKDVHDAIHSGIRGASRRYLKWSRGWTLADSGVEGLLVAEIAAAVSKKQAVGESLLLEVPYELCLRWSGARPQGRRLSTFKGQRADIALFNNDGQTKYVIEVKRALTRKTLSQDLTKLADAIAKCSKQEDGKLKRAFLAVFLQCKSDVRLNNAKRWTDDFFESRAGQHVLTHEPREQKHHRNAYSTYSICIEVGPPAPSA